jgi:hypothetical protein
MDKDIIYKINNTKIKYSSNQNEVSINDSLITISKIEEIEGWITILQEFKEEMEKALKCYQCGSTEKVEKRVNPYSEDVEGDKTKRYICDKCYNEALSDI